MRAIKVCDKNIDRIVAVIEDVQKRTRERNIDVNDIFKAIKRVEEFYNIPKKHMVGLTINYDCWADTYPNAYKYTPYSTQFVVECRNSGWFVFNIRRDKTGGTRKSFTVLGMEEDTKDALIKRYSKF